jgi:hypothetical protein
MADVMVFDLVRTMLLAGHSSAVLADYLEEQGHPLADWVRQAPKKLEIVRRLAGNGLTAVDVIDLPLPLDQIMFVLEKPSLISASVIPSLLCDFVEHVLPLLEANHPNDPKPREVLHRVRNHFSTSDGKETKKPGALSWIVERLDPYRDDFPPSIWDKLTHLASLDFVPPTMIQRYFGPVATYARYATTWYSVPDNQARQKVIRQELRWQLKHIRSVLQEAAT